MSDSLSKGSRLGDYEIVRAIKSGGMGDVLLARRRGVVGFEKLFAVKTMRNDLRDVESVRTMFADEARLLARLDHPAIAQVHDFGDHDGLLYLVMEYVAGIGFRDLMKLDPGPGIICQALAEACRGLHAAHELRDLAGQSLGVVHRDVSPENLMLSFEGRVKVLDFGIALVRGRQAPVTEFGTLKGKPPYLSPEQVKGEAVDRRTDVFASAVVLHEMLTGEQLFAGNSVYAIARAIEHRDIPPPSELAGPLPDGLDELVLRGLERNPAERLQTAQLMAEGLAEVAASAGAESLDSYALRELAGLRERHRSGLRAVLEGELEQTARARPTGSVTALAFTMPGSPSAPDADAQESLDDAGAYSVAPVENMEPRAGGEPAPHRTRDRTSPVRRQTRRSSWLWVGLALALVGLGGLAIRSLSTNRASVSASEPQGTGERVARLEVDEPDEAVRPSIIEPAEAAATEAVATEATVAKEGAHGVESETSPPDRTTSAEADGRERSTTRSGKRIRRRSSRPDRSGPGRDSNRAARDAEGGRAASRPVGERSQAGGEKADDAPVTESQPVASPASSGDPGTPEKPVGFGVVNVAATPYALVRIDGKQIGTTPIFGHRLPAGRHEVILVSPKTDEVRLRRTFNLGVGGTERIIVE